MVHLLAAFAEHEREQISRRTKDALAAAKSRGIRLGRNGAERLALRYRDEAAERARKLAPVLSELKSAGMSARQMAAQLIERGVPSPNGARWHAATVLRAGLRWALILHRLWNANSLWEKTPPYVAARGCGSLQMFSMARFSSSLAQNIKTATKSLLVPSSQK